MLMSPSFHLGLIDISLNGVAQPLIMPSPIAETGSNVRMTLLIESSIGHHHLPWSTLIASLSTTSSSFNSLFRVLLIFPSRYLFAIGLPQCI